MKPRQPLPLPPPPPPPAPPPKPGKPVVSVRPSYDHSRHSIAALPPPAPFLMDRDTILATERAYAYISEMPPPPATPPSGSSDMLPTPPDPLQLKGDELDLFSPEVELPLPEPPASLASVSSLDEDSDWQHISRPVSRHQQQPGGESLYGIVKITNGDCSSSCTSQESHAYFELEDPDSEADTGLTVDMESSKSDVPCNIRKWKKYSYTPPNWYPTYSEGNTDTSEQVARNVNYKTVWYYDIKDNDGKVETWLSWSKRTLLLDF